MGVPGSGGRPVRRTLSVVIAEFVVLTIASCSSSNTTAPTSSAPTSQSLAAPSSQAGTSASSADVAAIKNAYAKFFDPNTSVAQSVALVQDGPAFRTTLEQQGNSTQAKGASATVSTVILQSPDTAKVTFTLSLNGSPVLKDTPGYAVREKAAWKVAGTTFCGLLTLNGAAPPACNTAAATALPN
ncbi:MAG: hypothetical protein JWO57_4412 [Pseudonocardiales bacterium]|nr:hypothetical protein [Pseudonocardiales bacterium]